MTPARPRASGTTASRRLTIQRALFAAGVVVQLVVLYLPRSPSTGGLPTDKLVHATIFGGVLWLGARASIPLTPLLVILCAHAVISELIQHYLLPHRSGDPLDVLADTAGVAIVTLLLTRQPRRPARPG